MSLSGKGQAKPWVQPQNHTHTHIHTHTHAHAHTHMYTHTRTHTHAHSLQDTLNISVLPVSLSAVSADGSPSTSFTAAGTRLLSTGRTRFLMGLQG